MELRCIFEYRLSGEYRSDFVRLPPPEVLRDTGIFRIEAPTLEQGDAFIMNHGRMQRVPIVRGFIRCIREAKVGLGSPRSLCKGRIR
jgi:hypothetical protein